MKSKLFHDHIGVRGRRQYYFETYFCYTGYEKVKNRYFHVRFSFSSEISICRAVPAPAHTWTCVPIYPYLAHEIKAVSWSYSCARTPTVPFWDLFWSYMLWKSKKSIFPCTMLIIIRNIDCTRGVGARAHLQLFSKPPSYCQRCFMII